MSLHLHRIVQLLLSAWSFTKLHARGFNNSAILQSILNDISALAPTVSDPETERAIREQMSLITDDVLRLGEYPLEPEIGVMAAPIHKDDQISAAMFGLRSKGDTIPLHDHQ